MVLYIRLQLVRVFFSKWKSKVGPDTNALLLPVGSELTAVDPLLVAIGAQKRQSICLPVRESKTGPLNSMGSFGSFLIFGDGDGGDGGDAGATTVGIWGMASGLVFASSKPVRSTPNSEM